MASNFGQLRRDLIGCTLEIQSKLIIDKKHNLCVANAIVSNLCVQFSVATPLIEEKDGMEGIQIVGDLNLAPFTLFGNVCGNILTGNISPKPDDIGVVLNTFIPKRKIGLGRVYSNTNHTIIETSEGSRVPLRKKSFESSFTTPTGIFHPNGNTFVTFQAPFEDEIGCTYSNAYVHVDVSMGVNIIAGDTNDELVFSIVKNETDTLSKFVHTLMGPCLNVETTFAWSDLVAVSAGDVLDIFARGDDDSGTLNVSVRPGEVFTSAAFEIKSFDP